MKYSIILRTYNETEALIKSIESVLGQLYRDWELVIVDDGSENETVEIIDDYVELDKRIRAIHKCNQGSLAAFRIGIKAAKGDYIAFLDAGDLYEDNYLSEADRIFSGDSTTDMVVFGIKEDFGDHEVIHSLISGEQVFTPKELFRLMEEKIGFFGLIYRVTARGVFDYTEEEDAFYDEIGRSGDYGDDLYLLSPVLCNCSKVYVLDKPLYRYVYNENSLSHGYKSYTWEDAWNRNRLIEFTYNNILKNGYVDRNMHGLMCRHAISLLLPCAKWIVRHGIRNARIQRQFWKNAFYKHNVSNLFSILKYSKKTKNVVALLLMKHYCKTFMLYE